MQKLEREDIIFRPQEVPPLVTICFTHIYELKLHTTIMKLSIEEKGIHYTSI